MKPQMIGIGVVVLVIAAGVFFFLNQNPKSPPTIESSDKSEEKMVIEETESIDSVKTIGETDASAALSGSYVPYTKAAYEGAIGTRRVLYFYATWCPECKTANAEFEARLNEIPEDIAILRVNYNDPDTDQEEKVLAGKYFITTQHIFVQVDDQGIEITKWHGGALDKLLTQIE